MSCHGMELLCRGTMFGPQIYLFSLSAPLLTSSRGERLMIMGGVDLL